MYGILCKEKKCETLRNEGKLIKGIANGLEGGQGTTCFLCSRLSSQFRGPVYRLLGPEPKVSMILSKRGQIQGKFFMSIYFILWSEMDNFFYTGNRAKCWGWTTIAAFAHTSPKWLTPAVLQHTTVILLVQLACWLISTSGQIKLSQKMDLAPEPSVGELRRWSARSEQADACSNKCLV